MLLVLVDEMLVYCGITPFTRPPPPSIPLVSLWCPLITPGRVMPCYSCVFSNHSDLLVASSRLLHTGGTPPEADIHPCHSPELRGWWGVSRVSGLTLNPSDNPLCPCLLPEMHRRCDQDDSREPSLSSLPR